MNKDVNWEHIDDLAAYFHAETFNEEFVRRIRMRGFSSLDRDILDKYSYEEILLAVQLDEYLAIKELWDHFQKIFR